MLTLSFTLDGAPVTLTAEPKRPAVDVLREELGIRSLKPGCSPQGICGSCAASINGKFRLTCTLPFKSLSGKEVQTLDGWSNEERTRWARAFAATGAARTGYSAPGLLAHLRLLEGESDDKILRGLNMHACRSGWSAVRAALTADGVEDPAAEAMALGQVEFIGDVEVEGMLHGALVVSPIVRGRVRLDATAAREVDGVVEVFGPELGVGTDGQTLLVRDVEHVGQPIALVVATSRHVARKAAALVEIDAKEKTPKLDAARSRVVVGSALDEDGNPSTEPAVRVEVSLSLPALDAGCVEPEGAVAIPGELGITLKTNGSCAGMERIGAAVATELIPEHVHTELVGRPPLLGGRAEPLVGPIAAAAAVRLWQPVKLCLELTEGMAWHGRRHATTIELMLGADRDGTLTHLVVEVEADAGSSSDSEAFAYRALAHASGPYRIPNRSVSSRAFETNNPPAGDLRGEGAVQVTAALELALDRLARELGTDPLSLRRKNLSDDATSVADLLDRLGEVPDGAVVTVAMERRVSPVPADLELEDGVLLVDRGELASWTDELLAASGAREVRFSSDAPPCLATEPELARRALANEPGAEIGEGTGAAVAVVQLDADGAVASVRVLAEGPESRAAELEACVAAGLGAALTEQVATADGFGDTRLRNLGLLKARDMPPVSLEVIPTGTWREGGTAILMAVPAAVAAAVERFEGVSRASWPMRDSEAAYSVGVRRPRR
ncbi:MAG: molybdopterin-dependent oxidoreductase [Proteobacteria bacterium]|nr:molybdopterin-dependent oxidoreductase [Pseudomonadota bacterium]